MADGDMLGVSFDLAPYRKTLAEVMRSPPFRLPAEAALAEAAQLMTRENVGALLITEKDCVAGILTERDLTRALAVHGTAAATLPVGGLMTRTIASMAGDAQLFRAIGRMRRLNLRYLPVVDELGGYIGVVSARALLRQRAAETQSIIDGLDTATSAEQLGQARAALPDLARLLMAEKLAAHEVAAAISGIYADITSRAAALVEKRLNAELGPAPAPWCLLMLGSGGRGESLLKPDQDNAIVHGGNAADDAWYARAGELIADLLDAAGIPYCKGGVMAKNAIWRGDMQAWRQRIGEWIGRHSAAMLLNVDIFYDLKPLYGDAALAQDLRLQALQAASRSPLFLRLLAEQAAQLHPAIGLFGRLVEKDGRVDLKLGGLLPLVSAARLLALKLALPATATRQRLMLAAARGLIGEEDLTRLLDAHELILGRVLRQQIEDIAKGEPPSSRVDVHGLSRREVTRLKRALGQLALLPDIIQGAITH
ncbi:DUF294 nucleotidyltransferase-like domain-containing protein [Ferrovibrio sp.]|uniref:DUF294 nucleotidyltransferase-like domain-containing protein n=1 Tax=Ferrovibrio sp. TaxID=1917215 RepID=UPI0025BB2113|nr:DUF294 nucleotidyltransferase-like domain-containing protein [Ferrovibrio sp.]MBX3454210.1 CBS domain-containing protein [Ferrovibrio sp.]